MIDGEDLGHDVTAIRHGDAGGNEPIDQASRAERGRCAFLTRVVRARAACHTQDHQIHNRLPSENYDFLRNPE